MCISKKTQVFILQFMTLSMLVNRCRKIQFKNAAETKNFGECRITSGKVEGTVRKIKFIRTLGFGYPDDDYFFLNIIDGTRKNPRKNP